MLFFFDSRSHQLDLLDHLVGPLANARGTARRLRPVEGLPGPSYAVEDVVSLSFDTPSGAIGTASWNFCSGVWEDIVDIVGEFGSVSFSCFNNKPVRLEVAAKVSRSKHGRDWDGRGRRRWSDGSELSYFLSTWSICRREGITPFLRAILEVGYCIGWGAGVGAVVSLLTMRVY